MSLKHQIIVTSEISPLWSCLVAGISGTSEVGAILELPNHNCLSLLLLTTPLSCTSSPELAQQHRSGGQLNTYDHSVPFNSPQLQQCRLHFQEDESSPRHNMISAHTGAACAIQQTFQIRGEEDSLLLQGAFVPERTLWRYSSNVLQNSAGQQRRSGACEELGYRIQAGEGWADE